MEVLVGCSRIGSSGRVVRVATEISRESTGATTKRRLNDVFAHKWALSPVVHHAIGAWSRFKSNKFIVLILYLRSC